MKPNPIQKALGMLIALCFQMGTASAMTEESLKLNCESFNDYLKAKYQVYFKKKIDIPKPFQVLFGRLRNSDKRACICGTLTMQIDPEGNISSLPASTQDAPIISNIDFKNRCYEGLTQLSGTHLIQVLKSEENTPPPYPGTLLKFDETHEKTIYLTTQISKIFNGVKAVILETPDADPENPEYPLH